VTGEDIAEVWQLLDRDHLREVVLRGPPPVFASVSGAHLYGFASPDSDVDLRGAFLLPVESVLGLNPPKETVTLDVHERYELDWVAHDLRKFSRLLTQHNGYVLEQLYSPLVVVSSPLFLELREVARGCITRPTVRHFRGFARGRRRRLVEPGASVKHLLYAYRVLLAGIHLMKTGEVCSSLSRLNDEYRLDVLDELMARKREGAEKMLLAPGEAEVHGRRLDSLEEELARAHAESRLPEEPTGVRELEELVIRARLGQAR